MTIGWSRQTVNLFPKSVLGSIPSPSTLTARHEMTTIEKAIIVISAFIIVGLGTFLYVIAHFLAKFW